MRRFKEFIASVSEESPTNSAGGGQVDGIGVGSKGEPGGKRTVFKPVLKRRNKRDV